MALGTAQLTALVFNYLREKSAPALSPEEILPFPPRGQRLSEAETELFLDRFFHTEPNGGKP